MHVPGGRGRGGAPVRTACPEGPPCLEKKLLRTEKVPKNKNGKKKNTKLAVRPRRRQDGADAPRRSSLGRLRFGAQTEYGRSLGVYGTE